MTKVDHIMGCPLAPYYSGCACHDPRDAQIAAMRDLLTRILDLYPYLHCVCGRERERIPEAMRAEARKLSRKAAGLEDA